MGEKKNINHSERVGGFDYLSSITAGSMCSASNVIYQAPPPTVTSGSIRTPLTSRPRVPTKSEVAGRKSDGGGGGEYEIQSNHGVRS